MNQNMFTDLYRQESALDLSLEGSVGSFSVGTGTDNQNSIEVKYFLTHVGLDFSGQSNERLLKHLAPVREIFDVNHLDFDEIMQRDIDDSRVSSELIPYLLDEKSTDLIKLFPPIVVVVLPLEEGDTRPAKYYPSVSQTTTDGQPPLSVLRSGSIGKEVFQFEQPINPEGKILKHDFVRFKLNTDKTKLVIVDGQHRAMALLAIYRNIKNEWSDARREPFEGYYSQWTKEYIKQFNLKEINLPVMLCTFPSLDEKYTADYDLRKAARSVFLTLNRNARKVSRTRNILLDDNDIIAYFLRSSLSLIKNKDQRSRYSLRIANVELDQSDKEKMKIGNPVAITGVSHLYYVIEHLLLSHLGDVKGIKPRSGKFAKRKDLQTNLCIERLDGIDQLGVDVANSIRRDDFSANAAKTLAKVFKEKYGDFIVYFFERFLPYEHHNKAVLELEKEIESDKDRQLKPILLEGQGMSRVFEAHRENLKSKIKDGRFKNIPEIYSISNMLDAKAKRLSQHIEDFKKKRACLFIQEINNKSTFKDENGEVSSSFIQWLNSFYDNFLKTVAFQSALICTFFGELERVDLGLQSSEMIHKNTIDSFEEYIDQINDFFMPTTPIQFKRLVSTFNGDLDGQVSDWVLRQTNETFRDIVYRGEMQPDLWTKYRYLILEIWQPENHNLKLSIELERSKCREQIFSYFYNHLRTEYCKANRIIEDNLEHSEINQIFEKTFDTYNRLLRNMGSPILKSKREMKEACVSIPASEVDESEDE